MKPIPVAWENDNKGHSLGQGDAAHGITSVVPRNINMYLYLK